eukprot:Pompholyxophrys_punicea_v1_NODE_199_length_2817_cov_7.944605.p3 type:complete len:133 gc:universal NODE_199_length_2817_cov_7.944605:1318-1716(+)
MLLTATLHLLILIMIFLHVVCLSSFTTNIVIKSMKISKNWNNVLPCTRKNNQEKLLKLKMSKHPLITESPILMEHFIFLKTSKTLENWVLAKKIVFLPTIQKVFTSWLVSYWLNTIMSQQFDKQMDMYTLFL